jgi:TonB family protein
MKPLSVLLVVLACLIALVPASAVGQSAESDTRKVIKRSTPKYPEAARLMQLSGSVRLEALVEASGDVKNVKVKGGSPVFIQCAQEAVREWKWQKGDRETTENIEINFNPH